jgi:hypothetical protein
MSRANGVLVGEEECRYRRRILIGKPKGKRPLGRPRRKWMYNVRMDLKERRSNVMVWTDLAQDRD